MVLQVVMTNEKNVRYNVRPRKISVDSQIVTEDLVS